MPSEVTFGAVDYDGEKSTWTFLVPALTSANYDASLSVIAGLATTFGNVMLQVVSRKVIKAVADPYGGASADPNAQRENKWRVIYNDTVDPIGNGSFEIPCPDLSLLVPGTGEMNTAGGAGAALVTAIEANLVSRLDNPIEVQRIVHVGRNI